MQKMISIYIGILVGNLIMHFSVNWSEYLEGVYIPSVIRFLFILILLMFEVTVLITLMFFVAKAFYSELLKSVYNNFLIGFLFAVFCIMLSIVFASKLNLLNNNLFVFLIVPIVTFSALIYFNHLFFSLKNN
ncbi:MAG: hypothetical protein BWY69_00309 [Planctomycetes bacterium ADurb.Bin401]|nr:MAG: hypothetical protein BWY69_00309 [Planctomycetes bacterium ADurb.Bin401]